MYMGEQPPITLSYHNFLRMQTYFSLGASEDEDISQDKIFLAVTIN